MFIKKQELPQTHTAKTIFDVRGILCSDKKPILQPIKLQI
jgi:hypothetical protein